MKLMNSKRFMSFSQDQQDIVQAGVDLYKHYLYLNKDKKQYVEFAQGKSYEEKQKLFTENLVKEAFKYAGVANSGFKESVMMRNPNVQWAMFALIAETLDTIIPNTILDEFYRFAETRIGGYGDNFVFEIPNRDLFTVSKVAQGIRKGAPQRLWNSQTTLTPVPRMITIQEDFYRVIAGKIDWGQFVTKVALSFETQISVDVYNALYGSYAGLATPFKSAAFTQDSFIQLAERIEGMNRGTTCSVFGTRTALSKVLPDSDYMKFQLGQEYNTMGYLANFHGVNLYMLQQKIVPNSATYEFAVDNSTLYFVSMASDKPIKVAFEGNSEILQNQQIDNADMTLEYTIKKSYEVAVITSATFGIMKVA